MLIQKMNKILLLILLLFAATAHAAQTVTYFHNDVAGTPLLATDASGNVVWKENYYPYGERLNRDANNNKLWFTGKPYDNDTGLTYLGARYYNPFLGRFMGVDPKGFNPENIHSFNRYAYANNNPYRYIDPDGHTPIDVGFLIYDIGKVAVAAYTGQGIGMALADVAMSALGVVSPIPGTGQALKVVRAEQRWAEVASAAHKAKDFTQKLNKVNENVIHHIFGQKKHKLEALLEKFGGNQEKAFSALDDAAQKAFKEGKLNLKGGINTETRINVNGIDVDLVGGRVMDGRFEVRSASRRDIE